MTAAAVIFVLTYLVLGLQKIPRLHIGRPAGALLGSVAMVLAGVLTLEGAKRAIDLDTSLFLLGMMIVLAYLDLSGFFELLERRILGLAGSPDAAGNSVAGAPFMGALSRSRVCSRTRGAHEGRP